MPMGERDTRPRFQIALKGNRASLVSEFDNNVNRPRSVLSRVDATSLIVLGMSSLHVGSDASVIPWWALVVPEHVDEPLRHDSAPSKQLAARADAESYDLARLQRQNQSTVVVLRSDAVSAR